ncbi:MAG: DUF262 domain-containing protein [Nitrospirota bacterium]
MNLPEPQTLPYSTLMSEIEKGIVKIPQFQRDFIWSKRKACKLMDSIVKGYPIGTFIFWKTKERLRSIRNIGGIELPEPPEGDFIQYVLDGQQRLTSLFTILKGLKIVRNTEGSANKKGGISNAALQKKIEKLPPETLKKLIEILKATKEDDFSEMYVDLSAKEDDEIIIIDIENVDKNNIIKLNDLLFGSLKKLANYPSELHEKIDAYRQRIQSYPFPAIIIKEASLDVATEIFTRINVGGVPLTVFEIMVAKTYDAEKNFDLAEKYNELVNRLSEVDYETISPATVLQTVSVLMTKECSKKRILNLNKHKFIAIWNDTADAIERAIDYFRGFYRIPVSQLLPYNALIVPFAYFFYHHNDKPTGDKQKYLQDFFWRCTLSVRYSSAVESKLAQDIKRIDTILKDELPKYDYAIDSSPEFIKNNGWFSAGRSYIKAILCIYAHHQPKSFIDNSIVQINNNWLKQANSKNYHHFFPKAYLDKKEMSFQSDSNHILNITIVDDFLNKRKIRDNAPSKYMAKFAKDNPHLAETMKTHLIDDFDKFGIWADDYDRFIDNRALKVSEEIKKRIIVQEVDTEGQEPIFDDEEEVEIQML